MTQHIDPRFAHAFGPTQGGPAPATRGAIAAPQAMPYPPMSMPGTPRAQPLSEAGRLMRFEANKKSMALAYILWWFLGCFGGHRFYLGRTGSAVAMLCIMLGSFVLMFVLIGFLTIWIVPVWAIIDAFLIPGIVREHNQRLIWEIEHYGA
jgi:TM2 domain-containing membrane protein YozV